MNLHADLLLRFPRKEEVPEEAGAQVGRVCRGLLAPVAHCARGDRQLEVGLLSLARLESRFSVDRVKAKIARNVGEPLPYRGSRAQPLRLASLVSKSWRSISAQS